MMAMKGVFARLMTRVSLRREKCLRVGRRWCAVDGMILDDGEGGDMENYTTHRMPSPLEGLKLPDEKDRKGDAPDEPCPVEA